MFLLLLIGALIVAYFYRWSGFRYWKKRNVPNPEPSLLFGNLGDVLTGKRSAGQIYCDIYRNFPDVSYVGFYRVGQPGLVLRDPQLIRDVLNKDFNSFYSNAMVINEEINPLAARTTFFLNGDKWKIAKNQIAPCFTPKKIREMHYLEDEINNGGSAFEGHQLFAKYATEVVASCAFGLEGKTFDEPDPLFIKMGKKLFEPSLFAMLKMAILFIMPSLSKIMKIEFISDEVTKYFCNITEKTLHYRSKNNVIRNDFLDSMLEFKAKLGEGQFTNMDVAGRAAEFFFGGFETTANPEMFQKLRSEVDEALLKRKDLDYSSVQELKYLESVICETLRLHPPGLFLLRACTKPCTFPPPRGQGTGKDVDIQVDVPVIISVYGLQTDPKYFKDPYIFNPERFMPENKESIVRGTYLPFGDGPRACHGQRFAINQSKVALINVVTNFDVTVNRKTITPFEIDPKYLMHHVKEQESSPRINWKVLINKRIPVTSWLPHYTWLTFLQDILAGFTVGLTEIPQAIAYAIVAGLPPQYGLYSGLLDCFVYFIFGTCKDINIGPTAIMALMIQPHVEKLGPDMAVLITFLSGIIIFILGLLHLGCLVEFFSYPVIAGFTSAAAIQIGSSQIKSLLGIPGKANAFMEAWINVFKHIAEISWWDTLLGVSSIILLMLLKLLGRYGCRTNRPELSVARNILSKVLWLSSIARNAIVVIFGTVIAWIFYTYGDKPFILTGNIGKGLPTIQFPPFSTEFNNKTYTFGDMIKQYESSVAFVPLIAILEHVAIAKAFAKGKTVDATQEMIALGLCNLSGSFIRSMPVTGSFTRTAVNNASGVQTPLAGIVVSIMVLLSLGFLTSTFYFIPKATLAAVVICAMIYLIDYNAIITLWRTKKTDLIPFIVTLLASLLVGLEYGILIGIGSNMLFVLYSSARPSIEIEREKLPQGDIFIVTPSRSLQFPSAEYLREKIIQDCYDPKVTVVLNGKYINNVDATVAKNFKVLADDLILREQSIIFWNFKDNVRNTCKGVDPKLVDYFKEGSLEDIVEEKEPSPRINWKVLINKRIPVTSWLPHYTWVTFLQDILAGFTVGLTEIPQAIAYAIVAGLPPQYGLYTGLLDCFVYFIFGTCKDINIGPTSITALMIQSHVEKLGPDMAVLITFLSGIIIFILGLLHLGCLVEFFSYPVIVGFTSAAAIQIGSSQIKILLGIPGKANEFMEVWINVFKHIAEISWWDTLLGVSSIILLMLLKLLGRYGCRTNRPELSVARNILSKVLWLSSIARNAIVVIFGTVIAWAFYTYGEKPFVLTDDIDKGLPTIELPPFSTEFNNKTYTFGDMIKQYESSVAFVPLVAILEHVVVTKAFANGKTVDATQEMIALGLCNLCGSFVRSMPVTGSFTRTAVNNASGVQTPLAGIVVSIMVLLSLGFLTSTFYFIPKATLAAVIIYALIHVIDYNAIITLWRTKSKLNRFVCPTTVNLSLETDVIPFIVTLLVSLLAGLEYGMLIGTGSNMIFVLYSSARPSIEIEREKLLQGDIFIVTPRRSLQFPSAEYLREKIIQDCYDPKVMVVLDGKYMNNIDATVAKNFKVLADDLILREQNIIFWNFKDNVRNTCKGVDPKSVDYFKEGSLEDIVEDAQSNIVPRVLIRP
ncbi:hypothetical protein RI129_009327 [Pyrocoelia pectoralis]|uniref:SLC26A/SulP transporter domain-containing protein n=1 Tax=Pyrocoelia pectoralis TaxID=417401 RepID=A0AAN7V1M1_9COLE